MNRNATGRQTPCLACLTLAMWIGAGPALADDQLIDISNFAFSPKEISIPAGTKVTFRNDDDMVHTIVATDGSFRSQPLDTGDTFAFTFDKPGDYAFMCGLHPFMHGTITVTQ